MVCDHYTWIHGQSVQTESMMHFFRAGSWLLDEVRGRWFDAVKEHAPVFNIFGRCVLVGDGVKQPKEGHYMPSVKRMA